MEKPQPDELAENPAAKDVRRSDRLGLKRERTKPSKRRGWIVVLALLVSIAATNFLAIAVECRRLAPPEFVNDLKSFAALMPAPRKLCVVGQGADRSVVWIGRSASVLALPSGPSCYVFDSNGRLQAWAPMTGDGSDVDVQFNASLGRPSVSVEEAIRKVSNVSATTQ